MLVSEFFLMRKTIGINPHLRNIFLLYLPLTLPVLEMERAKQAGEQEKQVGLTKLILRLVTIGILFEVLLVPFVFVISPFLVLINAIRMAAAIWETSVSKTWYLTGGRAQKAFFLGKVVRTIEALFQALPELVLQVSSFLSGDLEGNLQLYLSISASALSILLVIITFIQERDQLRFTMTRISSRRNTDSDLDTYTHLLNNALPNQKGELKKRPEFPNTESYVRLSNIPLGMQITLFNGLLEALEVSLL